MREPHASAGRNQTETADNDHARSFLHFAQGAPELGMLARIAFVAGTPRAVDLHTSWTMTVGIGRLVPLTRHFAMCGMLIWKNRRDASSRLSIFYERQT